VNVLHAIRGKMTLPFIDHFWSLSVEEHFYFVWPFIVKICDRRRLMFVSIAVAFASVLSRALLVHQVGTVGTFVLTPFRLDTLCWGGFLAAYARGPDGMQGIWRRIVPGLAILFGVVLLSLAFNRFTGLGFEELRQVRSACFGMMLSALVVAPVVDPRAGPIVRLTSSAWLRSLGKYSYGLYVFHHFFSYYIVSRKTEFRVAEWVGSHTLAVFIQAAVAFAASLAVAVVSFRLVESKFIAFKRLWEPKPVPATAAVTAPEQVS
jgi:peptidoglycan/LPS O-acetylase OafA/YrhL